MKKVTSVLNIDEFPFRISGDESSKKRRRLDKSFQHPITADRWLMSEDLLTASDVADLSLALKIYKNIRSRSTQIDDRFVTEPEVKEALNYSCFFNVVEAFTLLGQYEIRRKIKCVQCYDSNKIP